MPFQSTVNANIGFGVIGEIYLDGPTRAQPARLDSADPANNVIGRAFTVTAQGDASFTLAADPQPITAAAGGTGVFAGVLALPKNYDLFGTVAGGTLASSLTLPDQTIAELIQETAGMIVTLPAIANVGDWVYWTNATGILVTTAPGAPAPANSTRLPGGRVARFEVSAGGLAVITFNSNVTS